MMTLIYISRLARHCDCRVALLLAMTASAAIHVGRAPIWSAAAYGLSMNPPSLRTQ